MIDQTCLRKIKASPATNFLALTKTLQPVVSKWRLGCPEKDIWFIIIHTTKNEWIKCGQNSQSYEQNTSNVLKLWSAYIWQYWHVMTWSYEPMSIPQFANRSVKDSHLSKVSSTNHQLKPRTQTHIMEHWYKLLRPPRITWHHLIASKLFWYHSYFNLFEME